MITEAVFALLFAIPRGIIAMIPAIPVVSNFTGTVAILELFAIANQFFPVGQLLSYMAVWLALNILALTKSFIDWILTLIPLY